MNTLAQLHPYRPRATGIVIATLGSAALALLLPLRSSADTREHFREELLAQADEAVHERHPLEAIAAWRAAYEIQPEHWIACNIGKAELEHGSAREAAQYLEICLRLAPSSLPPEDKRKLEQYGDDLKAVRKQIGSVRIIINEAGADIAIDGKSAGKSPAPELFVDPGSHRVSIDLAGYKPEEIPVVVGKGESRIVAVTLRKETAAPHRPLPAPLPIAGPPADTSERSMVVLFGGVSAAVIAFGFGAAFTGAADRAGNQAEGHRHAVRERLAIDCTPTTTEPDCQEFQSADQDRQRLSNIATASFIGAGVAAAATIAYVIFPSSPVRPTVGKGASVVIAEW